MTRGAIIGPEPNQFQHITGSGAINEDIVFDGNVVLAGLKFHSNAVPVANENLVAQDSGSGWKFVNRNMAGDSDYAVIPDAPIPFEKGRTLNIAYANSDANALEDRKSVV